MKKKKIFISLALSGILLSSLFTSVVLLNNTNFDTQLESEVVSEKGIKISSIRYSNTGYGAQNVHFTIDPKVHTDEVLYSMKYKDGTYVEEDVFNITFLPDDGYIRLECLRPFTKQITLTLYSKANSNVRASVNIDFKEKVSVAPTLNVTENMPLSISNNITTTGGSITVDKSVTSSSVKFSSKFIEEAQEKLLARYEEVEYCNPQSTYYSTKSINYYGLEQTNCDYFFSNAYTPITFLERISLVGEYTYQENDDDNSYDVTATYYLTDLIIDDFFAFFDGSYPIFEYTVTVNSKTYTQNFGLQISSIPITNITITSPDICF